MSKTQFSGKKSGNKSEYFSSKRKLSLAPVKSYVIQESRMSRKGVT